MSDFLAFCRAHGVLIDALPPVGVWRRYKTEDKGQHRNGAVKFMGDHGFVQNWATMTAPALWQGEKTAPQNVQRIARQAAQETAQTQAQAARKAEWILSQCELATHAYMAEKGFPDELVNVWAKDAPLMVIPMRIGRAIVGCQLIAEDGGKKFLTGQRTGGAEFVFGNGGPHILCEGYATALSVRHALRNLKRRHTLHVVFSAGNLKRIAANLPCGYVIADNDRSRTGERVAEEIGWPYWLSDRVGEDFNDYHRRVGMFAAAQQIAALMRQREYA